MSDDGSGFPREGTSITDKNSPMPLDIFFIDDSIQNNPTRRGMGRLVGVGGLQVPGDNVRDLEAGIQSLCSATGFPEGPSGEFKWSPGRELWMWANLRLQARTDFILEALRLASEAGAIVMVVIEDATRGRATGAQSPEEDVVRLFLERAHHALSAWPPRHGIVLADRPSSRATDAAFLTACLETLQRGTEYTLPDRFAFNVVTTPSHNVRLLQLADVVSSCSLAFVSGESTWSPAVFEVIRPLIREEYSRRGGCGLKIHPDFVFANLYHWLLGDSHFVRYQTGHPLPLPNRPYAMSPDEP